MRFKIWIGGVELFPLILIIIMSVGTANAQSSTNYKMQKDVLDAGGALSTSMNFKLDDAAGQPSAIGNSSSTNYSLSAGYLGAFDEAVQPQHFTFSSNTGDSYSIVVTGATINGTSLDTGDEIGVFTPAGLCVGASVWTGTTPLALIAWIDDSQTSQVVDGYIPGETMSFRIWDQSSNNEYSAIPTYALGNGTFGDGTYASVSLEAVISSASVILPANVSGAQGSTVNIPIKVTTESTIGVAQFVIDYNSSILAFQNAQLGANTSAGGFSIISNANLAFPPSTPGTDKNVSVQVSSGASSFTGVEQDVAILTFNVVGTAGQTSPLAFDPAPTRTSLTTTELFDINNGSLVFQNGMFTVTTSFMVSGTVSYSSSSQPVSGVKVDLTDGGGTQTMNTNPSGYYEFTGLTGGAITLTPSKSGDVKKITGSDALLILRYLAFLETLSAAQKEAADVTMDGAVSGADALAILRYLAFFNTNIGHCGEWIFSPLNISTTLTGDLTGQDFSAYLLGEVTGDWTTSQPLEIIAQSQQPGQMQKSAGQTTSSMNMNLGKTMSSVAAQSRATLTLPTISEAIGNVVSVPVQVTTDSSIGLAQFVMEYDSTILRYESVQVGSSVSGFSVSLVNAKLPFTPTTSGTNHNVLIQVSGGGAGSFTGTDVEVAVLDFTIIGASGDSPLAFDQGTNKTFLTTDRLLDIVGDSLTFVDGLFTVITDVELAESTTLPDNFELYQNYPNPFNPTTTINFAVPRQFSGGVNVSLKVYNIQGQIVHSLVDEDKAPGFYSVMWDGKNEQGEWLSSGLYFYTVHVGEFTATHKMMLLK